jgi:hypothetical protein
VSIRIGIDNGLTGGIVALSAHHGKIIDMTPMPTITRRLTWENTRSRKVKGITKQITAAAEENEIDGRMVAGWILRVTSGKPCVVTIEECPQHADRQSTMRSMGISYGILIAAISVGVPEARLVIVRSGNPLDSWQRQMLGRCEKGGTKQAALTMAKILWPSETWLATKRSTVPHSGLVDAALIAEYSRLKNL